MYENKKEINLFAGMFTAEEIYRYGDIILLLGHIIYLVLFYRFGVYQWYITTISA